MVAHIATVAFHGVEAQEIDVQVHMANGLPAFTVVGLPDKAVAESRERVRSALAAIGLALPPKRITVNLDALERNRADPRDHLSPTATELTLVEVLWRR